MVCQIVPMAHRLGINEETASGFTFSVPASLCSGIIFKMNSQKYQKNNNNKLGGSIRVHPAGKCPVSMTYAHVFSVYFSGLNCRPERRNVPCRREGGNTPNWRSPQTSRPHGGPAWAACLWILSCVVFLLEKTLKKQWRHVGELKNSRLFAVASLKPLTFTSGPISQIFLVTLSL